MFRKPGGNKMAYGFQAEAEELDDRKKNVFNIV